jgi:hypothetical protein
MAVEIFCFAEVRAIQNKKHPTTNSNRLSIDAGAISIKKKFAAIPTSNNGARAQKTLISLRPKYDAEFRMPLSELILRLFVVYYNPR